MAGGAMMEPRHVLQGMIADGPGFPATVPALSAALAKMVGRSTSGLNYTLQELAELERAVRAKNPPDRRAEPDLFLPLVAYVSEVGRRELNGRWQMRLADDGKTWEPWVLDPEGNEFEFFTLVYKEFCDLTDET